MSQPNPYPQQPQQGWDQQPPPPGWGYQPQGWEASPPPKKPSAGKVIGLILGAVAAIVVVGAVAASVDSDSEDGSDAKNSAPSTPADTSTVETEASISPECRAWIEEEMLDSTEEIDATAGYNACGDLSEEDMDRAIEDVNSDLVEQSATPEEKVEEYPDGDYHVGKDIPPGTYTSAGAKPGIFEFCSISTDPASDSKFPQLKTANAGERIIITLAKDDGVVTIQGCEPLKPRK